MRQRSLRSWACVMGLLGAGCITGRERAPPVPMAAPAPPAPTCPESIAADVPLEADYGPRIRPRQGWPTLSASEFAFVPTNPIEEAFRQKLELVGGTVELLGLEERASSSSEGGAALVMARPVSGGYCVINTWATWQASAVDLTLAGSWTSPDRRRAILLLKLEPGLPEGGTETRWVVLGTDGSRAWIALGQPPSHQLIAPSASLIPQKDQLFLDVKIERINRLRLDEDGHFVQTSTRRR